MNKLTPREPTPEMVEAAQQLLGIDGKLYSKTEVTAIWKDMHDAAPSAEPVADEPCDTCAGTGEDFNEGDPCHKCKGKGTRPAAAPAERGEYPPDAVIAQCMLAVDDPLLWGRLGENSGDMVRKFARAVIDADRAQRVPSVSDEMVSRFLAWPLPKDFYPDCGISFDGRKDDEWNKNKTWPIGTNLLTAEQARSMLEHVLGIKR